MCALAVDIVKARSGHQASHWTGGKGLGSLDVVS
jgi:hypothetical protein